MKLRRSPIFEDLGRHRLGDLDPLASGVHVSRRVVLGAIGLAPVPIKCARDGETSGRVATQGANPCEHK